MRIEKCYFCSGPVYPGHGTMFVRNDCRTFRFCRSKCHKHFKAKHNPRKLAWTKAYRKLHNKQISKDTILQLQQIRNEPIQYNRQVYVKTIKAMKKIADIRKKREDRFWRNRMKLSKIKKIKAIHHELDKHGDLMQNQQLRPQLQENLRERLAKQQNKRGVMTIQQEN